MKTAQEIILEIQVLPPEERQIVVEYVESTKDEAFKITNYPPEVLEEIDRCAEEAKRGENVVGPFRDEEANEYLRRSLIV